MMKIYDCGDCYITSRLADWEVLAMLQGEGWDITSVIEVTEEEYLIGTGQQAGPEQAKE